jgi:tetratricopeptide (TPR) repeat protein
VTHPTPEALASFIDGTATAGTRGEVAEHIESCDDCLLVVGETARLLEEEGGDADTRRGWGLRRWPLLAAAAIAIMFAGAWIVHEHFTDPAEQLARVSRLVSTRPVEGRLDGFEYRPFMPQRSDGESANRVDVAVSSVASEIVERHASANNDAMRQHAAGVAALVRGDGVSAAAMLKRATDLSPRVARYWSDYAVALAAERRYAEGLGATDRAIAIAPKSAVALFNRALILEAIGERNAAVAAYSESIRNDHASSWTAEAAVRRDRLRRRRS